MLRLTQEQAAEHLQKTPRAIQDYERSKNPVVPTYADRVLMSMIARGENPPEPWPE